MFKYKINFFSFKNLFFYKIRLDKILSFYLIYFSRNTINKNIIKNKLYINGVVYFKKIFFSFNYFIIKFFTINILNKNSLNYLKNYIEIIYEDDFFFIINKPSGILIHPNLNKLNGNLIESLLNYYGKKILNLFRFGILNRLDKDTSGLMILFKSHYLYINFLKQIKYNIINKYYFSLNFGKLLLKNNKILGYLNYFYKKKKYNSNFFSSTNFFNFKKIFFKKNFFLIKSNIITGRTHQLRIHFNFINTPIVGDLLNNDLINLNYYKILKRHILHCYNLNFFHPNYNNNFIFKNYLPNDIINFLISLFRDGGIWTLDSN